MLTITEDNGHGVLSGRLGPHVYEAVREMPGRRRWRGRSLYFELSRANVEFLKQALPDAKWESARALEVSQLEALEEDATAQKRKDLPPEAYHFDFKTQPREHQFQAFHLSKDKPAYGLFLEMGLGKTKVALDNAAYLWANGKINTLIVTAPNGVHRQWIEEQVPAHLPEFVQNKTCVYQANHTKKWLADFQGLLAYEDGLRIFAINQEALATEKGRATISAVLHAGDAMWVLDESVSIKTPGAKRTKAILRLAKLAPYRRILTGAPVTKGVEDLFTQLKFLDEDILGYSSFYTFRNRYCTVSPIPGAPAGAVRITGYKNLDELKKRMNAYTFRKSAAECLDLPERVYQTREVDMTAEQKKLYIGLRDEFLSQLSDGTIVTADQAIVRLLRLQQILCGHIKTEDGVVRAVDTKRLDVAREVIEEAADKVVVWARFHHDIDTLAAKLKDYNPVTWDGRTVLDDRVKAKKRFMNDPDTRVFIANPSAAGTGLDGLQFASHTMIYYSNSFAASDRWQSEARLFRQGQTGTVKVVDLVTPRTVDTYILKALKSKHDVATAALTIGASQI